MYHEQNHNKSTQEKLMEIYCSVTFPRVCCYFQLILCHTNFAQIINKQARKHQQPRYFPVRGVVISIWRPFQENSGILFSEGDGRGGIPGEKGGEMYGRRE